MQFLATLENVFPHLARGLPTPERERRNPNYRVLDSGTSTSYAEGMSELFTEQLRRAIRESGMSRYAIWKGSGVDQATLSKFMSGRHGLSLESVEKLVEVLGLTLTTQKKRRDPCALPAKVTARAAKRDAQTK
jgi:hypothetical protein